MGRDVSEPSRRRSPRSARLLLLLTAFPALLGGGSARAEVAEPAGRPDTAFDFMNVLADHQVHDLAHEDWNAYGAITDIYSQKLGFAAKYSGTNSLSTLPELSFTETATLYLGLRLWPGAEAYFVPEVIGERPLSHLLGLGGAIQNFELQKNGTPVPTPYLSRAYVRQTIPLGGTRVVRLSDPLQLGVTDTRRKLVLTAGNFSILDLFDRNDIAGDLSRSFFNMGFLTYAAWDFAADARGYAWGGVAELDYDDWSLRFGRITPPKDPNQLAIDFRLDKVYGDQVELEHAYRVFDREGAVRLLGYRNVENMGRFTDAIAAFEQGRNGSNCPDGTFNYDSTNLSRTPNLCQVRRSNVKIGAGIAIEQKLSADIGVFFRGMYSDGQSEVYSYTSTDRSISVGGVASGLRWKRPWDSVGVGWSQGWISQEHATYLAMGGIDGFIGDGKISLASEQVFEIYYRFAIASSAWLTADYQRIWNPAYNADRGPVDVIGWRGHVEF
jgi:high affinity Mn2+ porin